MKLIQCLFIGFLIVCGSRAAQYTQIAYSVDYQWGVIKYGALTLVAIILIARSINNLDRIWTEEQIQKEWDEQHSD